MKKLICVLSVFLLCICAVAPVKAFAYDLPNGLDTDDVVTFGVYDHEAGALIESEPVEFGNYFLTGLAHALYESQYSYLSSHGFSENDIYVFLQSQDSLQPFISAALNGWLFNVFQDSPDSVDFLLCGIRIPSTNGHPSLDFMDGDVSGTYTWQFLPSGSSYFLLNSSNDLAYAVIGGSYPYINWTQSAVTLRSTLVNIGVTPSSLQDSSVSICYFSFTFSPSSDGFSFSISSRNHFCGSNDSNSSYYVQYGSGGLVYNSGSGYYAKPILYPVMCLFPFYYSEHVLSDSDYGVHLDLPPTDVFYPTSSLTNIYLSTYQDITPDPSGTPRPWITPTPIVINPVPTYPPDDGRVDPFVGIQQMFDGLIYHSYSFSYGTVEFSINPFLLFVSCVIIGLVVRMFVGGSHE